MPIRAPTRRFAALTATILTLFVSGCENCQGELVEIAPKLHANVCNEPQVEIDGEFIGGWEECLIDFGPSDISVRTTLEVVLTNPTTVDLSGREDALDDPMEIFLTTDSDPAFRIEAKPSLIEAGLKKSILLSYRPNTESTHEGKLVIRSDAANIADGQDVIIPINGAGIDNGIPNIEVDTTECKFGRIAAGSVAQCTVEISNTGSRALVFDDVAFLLEDEDGNVLPTKPSASEVEPFGFFGRPPAEGDVVAAPPEVNKINLSVRFTPDVLGQYVGKIRIASNDPDTPEIFVTLEGVGVDPPVCDVRIASVNGIPVVGSSVIEPLDDVVLTSEDSTPSTASGSITSVHWTIIDRPLGSTANLTSEDGPTTGFTFSDVLGVDLAGRYKVQATVIDDLGTESVNECALEFEAIPSDSFLVQLTWDTSIGDMDLHVVKKNQSGLFCPQGVETGPLSQDCGTSKDDCYYSNCKVTNGTGRPDWDGSGAGGTEGDPSLDIDDLSGYGPENTNIDLATEGEYLVGVDYFSFSGNAVGNTIRIYIYGQLQAEFYQEVFPQDFWEVAVIKWPGPGGGAPCIEDLSTTVAECP